MLFNFKIDPHVNSFIKASRISGGTEFNAVNYLVIALKENNLWNKIHALYPFVGGTAFTHKWNLKDPRDLDAAYRLSFSGTWVHSSTGAKPNGSGTTFANTYFVPASTLSLNSAGLGFYSRTNNTTLQQPIGAANTSFINRYEIAYNAGLYAIINTTNTTNASVAVSNTLGLMSMSRTSSTNINIVKNGVNIFSGSNTSTGLANFSVYIGAENLGNTVSLPSVWECSLAYFSIGLSVSEMIVLNTIVQQYQTILGRKV